MLTKKILISALACAISGTVLVACGGGGGSQNVVVDQPGQPLYTTAPSSLTLSTGNTMIYQIGGGGGTQKVTSYSAAVSDPSVVSATVEGSKLTISALKLGSATVTVKDTVTGNVDIRITVGSAGIFTIQAPSTVTINSGATTAYNIAGGLPPYRVVSSNVGVLSASVQGNSLSLTGLSAGGAQVAVYDAKGAYAPLAVTVANGTTATALYTTAPASISLSVGGAIPTYTIGGGTGPYTITSSAPDTCVVSQTGPTFTVAGNAIGFCQLIVRDSAGANSQVAVSVVSGTVVVPFYATAPSSVTISAGSGASYTLAGGTAPYTATSSNTSVVTTTVAGSTVSVQGANPGNASVVLKDAVGATVSFNVSVPSSGSGSGVSLYTTAPSQITVQTGAQSTFAVSGGVAPYVASTSNTKVANASMNGQILVVTGVGSGTAVVQVTDSTGSKVAIALTDIDPTNVSTQLFTTAPSTIVTQVGNTYQYTVTGGASPYTVTSSNTAVATAQMSGSTLTVKPVGAGNATIYITDKLGAGISITLSAN
ncbi:hypothetical protein [Flavobacterium sp.]|uniref:hypothetical protein n=1 Tax=Flavobacterium sp. TaxID=239 RepID=UPI00262AACD4|nr:hypothetical protein [Flavobacterium sp.]